MQFGQGCLYSCGQENLGVPLIDSFRDGLKADTHVGMLASGHYTVHIVTDNCTVLYFTVDNPQFLGTLHLRRILIHLTCG